MTENKQFQYSSAAATCDFDLMTVFVGAANLPTNWKCNARPRQKLICNTSRNAGDFDLAKIKGDKARSSHCRNTAAKHRGKAAAATGSCVVCTLHCVQQRGADINSQRQQQLGPYPFWLIFTHRRQRQQQQQQQQHRQQQHLQHKHWLQQQLQQHSFRHLINDRDCNQSSSPTLPDPRPLLGHWSPLNESQAVSSVHLVAS